MGPQSIRKRSLKERNAQRKKRRRCLELKSWEMGELCDCDIALIVYNREAEEYYAYTSTDRKSWPPTMEQIRAHPKHQIKLPRDIEKMKIKKSSSLVRSHMRKRLRRTQKDTTLEEPMSPDPTLSEDPSAEGVVKVMPFLSEPPSFDFTRTEKRMEQRS